MKMQDEDLDGLFNAKLKDLEIEPSADVWDKIAPAIAGNKKKSIAIYWQIAASVIVLLTAGLLFRPNPGKITLHGQYNGHEVAVVKPVQPVATDEFDSSTTHTADVLYHQTAVNSSSMHHDRAPDVSNSVNQDVNSYRDSIQHLAVVKPENAVKPERQEEIINTVAPVNTIADVTPKENTAKPLAIAAIPEQKNSEIKKKKKIHTLGDLFNVVIAKVDKRENKIIEFSDDDDDDAFTISGVNLGPLKVKKQN